MPSVSKISPRQAAALLITLVLSTGILVIPGKTLEDAGRGAWLSMAIGTAGGVMLVLIYAYLVRINPQLRLTDRMTLLLGPFFGKLTALGFSLFLFTTHFVVLREGSALVRLNFLPDTPLNIVTLGLTLISFYGAWLGLPALARYNVLYLPFFLFTFINLLPSACVNSHWDYLWPPWDQGLKSLASGAVGPLAWIGEISLFLFMAPQIAFSKGLRRTPLYAALAVGVMMMLDTMLILVALGPKLSTYYTFPLLQVGRTIFIGQHMRGLDALLMTIWVIGINLKLSLWLYYSLHELGYIFGMHHERALLVPGAALSYIMAISTLVNTKEMTNYIHTVWPRWALVSFEGLIPMVLLFFAFRLQLRRRKGKA